MGALSFGGDRSQSTLFPDRLDDYLGEDNPVRAVDVFVDELDLAGLRFGGVEPEATGRSAYHPAMLLKIYVYGYLNRVQSLTMTGQLAATAATCTVPTRNGGGSHPDEACRLVQDNGLKHKTKRG